MHVIFRLPFETLESLLNRGLAVWGLTAYHQLGSYYGKDNAIGNSVWDELSYDVGEPVTSTTSLLYLKNTKDLFLCAMPHA